jgi:membrane fusion protein (multidrug efflux system)
VITTVNPGQYVNPGDKIVTLQALDTMLIDFYLPQQELSRVKLGQVVAVSSDTYPGRTFNGKITSINPKVDPDSRNFQVEALINNARRELLPGMYATVDVRAGAPKEFLTLPQTAVTYNTYGDTVFIVEESGKGPDNKPVLTAKQSFVTVGEKRGDQVAILSGLKEGDTVVTSGQLKLKNGSPVVINNTVQPSNEAAPKPEEQ